ncbi:MAG: hypothetical protein H8E76_01170 [Helicobacteraceae bacterium]|nr:hypothetical protein [Candidatus Sulfurimonas ponti]
MFVSSYSTYIQSDFSSKESKQKLEKSGSASQDFSSKLAQTSTPASGFASSSIPIDYISRSQTHHNKQELEFQKEQLKNPDNKEAKATKETLNTFASHNSLSSARNAYEASNKMYSLFPKQSITINQTPKMDTNLPQEAYEAKDSAMKHTMVNTYISNDNYYRLTA